MTIDISQFVQVFLDESFEGLQTMESHLLNLDRGDPEAINAVFRAAHSIKGGAGSFGFSAVAEFTHGVETLLDEMRDGRREITPEAISLLLEAGDCIRAMLEAGRDGTEVDQARVVEIESRIKTMLGQDSNAPGTAGNTPEASKTSGAGWRITFLPHAEMLRSGNDPVRMFGVLDELGDLTVKAQTMHLPPLDTFDPLNAYLSWELELKGEVDEQAIREVFEWVEDECDLSIEALAPEREVQHAPADEGASSAKTPAASAAPTQAAPPSGATPTGGTTRAGAQSGSIRVNTDKIDVLINLVGELVITQSMLSQIGGDVDDAQDFDVSHLEKLRSGLAQLERNTRELQENVMSIRMLPISFSFNRFPRLVRDMSGKLGKKIDLKFSGENTELDKTVMEQIGDPLVHLVRNSLDHGIESPEVRRQAGKPETGTVHLNAYHQGGNIVIEISDDGAGLNREKIKQKALERGLIENPETLSNEYIDDLIFHPGFSTADEVSDLSGRGVGMDVVRRNIKSLGGSVEVHSEPGQGTTFTIRLPLTLAILDGQLIQVNGQTFVVPLVSIVESLQMRDEFLNTIAEQSTVYKLRDEYLPVVPLNTVFNLRGTSQPDRPLLVVVEAEGQKVGVMVDELLGQQQVVIKALEANFRQVEGLSGATILGDGTVALILDVAGLIQLSRSTPPGARAPLSAVAIEAA